VVSNLDEATQYATALVSPVLIQCLDPSLSTSRHILQPALELLPQARHLLLTRGLLQPLGFEDRNVCTLDVTILRRRPLLRAVAMLAGRAAAELQDPLPVEISTPSPMPPSLVEARAAGRFILIAEDDKTNQKVILKQLALLGYAADIADDGEEALRMWRSGDYDLLLTDVHMPRMDGYQLTEAIRREERNGQRMPILALTANALHNDANGALSIGMDEYLLKPLRLTALAATLEKWLPNEAGTATLLPISPSQAEHLTLELASLKELVGEDAETIREFLTDFRVSARQLADELGKAHSAGDLNQVVASAHKFKSAARSVGALALADLCVELEQAGLAENRPMLAKHMNRMDPELTAVFDAITDYLTQEQE